jgi:nucleoside-diphosphate-sugar epimerase
MSGSDTILVTGGAGYIGSMLTRELLSRGHRVVVADALLFGGESLLDLMSHPDFTFSKTDITDTEQVDELLRHHHFDAVVHLASIVGDPACKTDSRLARETIWEGSRRLFEAYTSQSGERFIFASTCSNYGKTETRSDMLDEDAPLRPVSLYAELKVRFERYLLEHARSTGSTILRFSTVYGLSSRPRFDLTVNEFVREAVIKGELEIYGPDGWRPYCHVRDIARAVALVLESPREKVAGKTFNVGSNEANYQKGAIADAVAAQVPVRLTTVDRDEDPRDYRVAFDRIAALGFAPQRRLADGIAEVALALREGLIQDPYASRYRNC